MSSDFEICAKDNAVNFAILDEKIALEKDVGPMSSWWTH